MLLAVAPGHWLAGRDSVTIPELADEPFVTTRPGHWQRALLERLFTSEGLTPLVSCEGDEPGASQDMINAGLGIGLIPTMSRLAGTEARAQVAWVHVDAPDCHRILTLVWNRETHLSDAALKFREFTTSRPFMSHRLPERRRERDADHLPSGSALDGCLDTAHRPGSWADSGSNRPPRPPVRLPRRARSRL